MRRRRVYGEPLAEYRSRRSDAVYVVSLGNGNAYICNCKVFFQQNRADKLCMHIIDAQRRDLAGPAIAMKALASERQAEAARREQLYIEKWRAIAAEARTRLEAAGVRIGYFSPLDITRTCEVFDGLFKGTSASLSPTATTGSVLPERHVRQIFLDEEGVIGDEAEG